MTGLILSKKTKFSCCSGCNKKDNEKVPDGQRTIGNWRQVEQIRAARMKF